MPSTIFDTDLGPAWLAWTERGVSGFRLPGGRLPDATLDGPPEPIPRAVRTAVARAQKHLAGRPQSFADVALDFAGVSPFQASVYRALQQVPVGKTVSYINLAELAGRAGASRAVGTAMAKNPWPLFVPCHRVLTERGLLGGFSAAGGVATKVRLLAIEGVAIDPVVQLGLADARLAKHLAATGPCGLEVKPPASVFVALTRSITYQQLHGKAAASILARIVALYPNGLDAAETANLTDEQLLGCGLSRSKLAAIRDLAAKSVSGEIPNLVQLASMSDEAIVESLSQVRGIGRWSVEMFLMFSLGRPDVLSYGDYGLRSGFQKLFRLPEQPTAAEFFARGEKWRPFRSVASWYLWRAADTL